MTSAMPFVASDFLDTVTAANPAAVPAGLLARICHEQDAWQALLLLLNQINPVKHWNKASILALLSEMLLQIDQRMDAQLNAILHQPEFQQLEANWYGLKLLCEQRQHSDREHLVKIKALNLSWTELSQDLQRAIEFDQSTLFAKIYTHEFGMAGGEPFGLLLGAYAVGHRQNGGCSNLTSLQELSRIAAAAFAPLVVNAAPELFGVDDFCQLAGVSSLDAHFANPEFNSWRALRAMDESRFLGMALPGLLMRGPADIDQAAPTPFLFTESRQDAQRDYLWGHACFGIGCVAIRAFCESGWFSQMHSFQQGQVRHGVIDNMPYLDRLTQVQDKSPSRHPLNWKITDRMQKQLSAQGFLCLQTLPESGLLVLTEAASVQQATAYKQASASMSSRLSTMLHYTLCVSRFAHYLKVMGRDRIGGYRSSQECESQLQRWLHGYTMASENGSNDMRARFPLRDARVKVKERAGTPGNYFAIIQLQPHFQIDQLVTGVRLVTELTPVHL